VRRECTELLFYNRSELLFEITGICRSFNHGYLSLCFTHGYLSFRSRGVHCRYVFRVMLFVVMFYE